MNPKVTEKRFSASTAIAAPPRLTRAAAPGANAAVFYHPDGYDTSRGKLMGRHAAGEGFLQGFARHACVDTLYAFAESQQHYARFCEQVRPYAGGKETHWLSHAEPAKLEQAGALYIPGPGLSAHLWQRRFRDPAAYSVTGVTHTICTDRVMDSLGDLLIAPAEEWDAVICTSDAVRRGVDHMLSAYGAYLAERFGAGAVRPGLQLPVIPLGVDCDRLAPPADADAVRGELRRRHGIKQDDVAVLFFGRLAYHAKAHPLPMYLALEAAHRATGRKLVLIQAGWFANDAIKRAFVQGAKSACPSVRVVYVDGRLPETRDRIWCAADIFCSLSDNIQETFGLTPVEAMAAGLPVIASDWNGYRGTVENGVTGFLAPTVMPAPGSGEEFVYRYFTGADTYDMYIGKVSQMIAVDAGETTRALIELVQNPELRRQMGERGRERARRLFDWRVIIASYEALWADLAGRRRAAQKRTAGRGHPLRADPFAVFGHYATELIDGDTPLRLVTPNPVKALHGLGALQMNRIGREHLAPVKEIQALLRRVKDAGEMRAGDLIAAAAPERHAAIRRTLGWLAKLGIVKCGK